VAGTGKFVEVGANRAFYNLARRLGGDGLNGDDRFHGTDGGGVGDCDILGQGGASEEGGKDGKVSGELHCCRWEGRWKDLQSDWQLDGSKAVYRG
jgi:hypothetical protein